MDLNLIGLILSAIMGLFLLVSVLYGLIIGLKRSLRVGIYNLVLVVVLLFTCSLITNFIINFDLSSFGFTINGANTLNNAVINAIKSQEQVASIIENSPEVMDLIIKLPLMILTPLIFTVLYWLIKVVVFILSLPVKLIVVIVRRPKRDKNGNKIKVKKHHLAGAAIGLVTGLIALFATFVPIFGIGDIVTKINNYGVDSEGNIVETNTSLVLHAEENTEENTTTPLIEYFTHNTMIGEAIEIYNNSIGIQIAKAIGLQKLGTSTFNILTDTNINGVNVKLLDEIDNVLVVYSDVNSVITLINKDSLTKAEMTSLLTSANTILENSFESNLVKAIGNTLIPVVLDGIQNNPNFPIKLPNSITDDELKNAITQAVINQLKNYDTTAIKTNLQSIVSLIQVVNDNDILTPVYNKMKSGEDLNTEYLLTLLKNSRTDFSSKISEGITSINLISSLAPTLLDNGLKAGFEALDLTYTSHGITLETAKNVLNTIFINVIDGAKTIDFDSQFYVTKNTFGYLGNVLNISKNTDVISSEQYNDLIDVAQTKLNDIELPVNISKVINNLDNVSNWSTEMSKIGECFDDVTSTYLTITSDTFKISNVDLTKIGKVFDKLETTTLFSNAITPIYNEVLNMAKDNAGNYGEAINVLKITENTEVNWENELTALKPMFSKIESLTTTTYDSLSDTKDKLVDFCFTFDAIEQDANSTIYSAKMQALLEKIFEITATENTGTDVGTVCTDILAQLTIRKTEETKRTFTKCIIKGLFDFAESIIPEPTDFSDSTLQAMITEIKLKISQVNAGTLQADLEKELDYIIDFAEFAGDFANLDSLTEEELAEFEDFLDSLSESVIFTRTKNYALLYTLNLIANNLPNNSDTNIQAMLNEIKDNIQDLNVNNITLSNLEKEINYLKDFENYTDYFNDLENLTDEQKTDLEDFLISLSDSVILNNCETHILNAIVDIAADSITGSDDLNIKNIIRSLKNNINVSISTLIDDLNSVKNDANTFDNLEIDTMDTTEISNTLNSIRAKDSFSNSFTNSIMNNLLDKINDDAQANTLLPATKKLEIATYVNTNKLSDSSTITNTTYKDILDGLKALFE